MKPKTQTMLKSLQHLLDRNRHDKKVKRAHLREVLSELRKRQRKLEQKLQDNPDRDKRRKLNSELAVICAQRAKGVALRRALK